LNDFEEREKRQKIQKEEGHKHFANQEEEPSKKKLSNLGKAENETEDSKKKEGTMHRTRKEERKKDAARL